MKDIDLPVKERKQKFELAVLVWTCLRDSHGGWDDTAKFFKISRQDIVNQCIQDLHSKTLELGLEWDTSGMEECDDKDDKTEDSPT